MRFLHIIILGLFATLTISFQELDDERTRPIEQLLKELDDAIVHKQFYQQQRQSLADSLRLSANKAHGQERIEILKYLHYNFENFNTDSTFMALELLKQIPEYSTDSVLQMHVYLSEARAYGVKGLYKKAYDMLNSLDPKDFDRTTYLQYSNTRYAVTGWLADFAAQYSPDLSEQLISEMLPINDTLYALEPLALNRAIIHANKSLIAGQYQEAIDSLQSVLESTPIAQRTFLYSGLSQAYGKLNRIEEEVRYLALTSINDIRSGNTEYMALPILAQRAYEMGQTSRAYSYLICSLEDANLCKASLRTIESSAIFPIIDHAQKEEEHRRRLFVLYVNISMMILLLLLVIGIVMIWRQRQKLNRTRIALANANNELKISNKQLQRFNTSLISADKVKEEYIMKFLSRSRHYLASFESWQRQMYKLIQAHQIEELGRQLKSTQVINDEQVHFYHDFDDAFLKLYPNFIEGFNALLIPEAQIHPKKGELLTTELRIFALIRLGETDSAQIAKFLNYSLTTIYNYRSRVRNNAKGDKDNFENEVMKL